MVMWKILHDLYRKVIIARFIRNNTVKFMKVTLLDDRWRCKCKDFLLRSDSFLQIFKLTFMTVTYMQVHDQCDRLVSRLGKLVANSYSYFEYLLFLKILIFVTDHDGA